jgi:hypothetical protein
MIAKVKYQVANYSGTFSVNCNKNDDDEIIIAKAKRNLRIKTGPFPLGYQSWKVISRD